MHTNKLFVAPSSLLTNRNLRVGILVIIFFFAFGIASYSILLPYLGFSGPIHTRLFALPAVFFYLHTVAGAIALVLAPFQLLKRPRVKWHKLRGYAYVVSVVLSSIGGLYMAQDAYGGLSSTLALSILSFIWLLATFIGLYQVLNKQLASHKRWMIRSVALTLSAITLRLLSPILYEFYDLYHAQQIIYWSCWIINLALAEAYLALRCRSSSLDYLGKETAIREKSPFPTLEELRDES
jgi:uncharacterized membrane protein